MYKSKKELDGNTNLEMKVSSTNTSASKRKTQDVSQLKNKKEKISSTKKKKKKETVGESPKFLNEDGKTVFMHNKYSPKRPYIYKVMYENGEQYDYTPIPITKKFGAKFKLPELSPSVESMCNLVLPNTFIDELIKRTETYALTRTKLPEEVWDVK